MKCSSFALSSEVPAYPVTVEVATACLERLRQIEEMWFAFLTAPEETPYCKAHPGEITDLAANADAWGRAANVGLEFTTIVGDVPAAPDAARVHLVANFSAFPDVNPDFVAFHTIDDHGREVCYVNTSACGAGWPEAAIHEILEARVNGTCSAMSAVAPDGSRWDLEVSDPVQGTGFSAPGTSVLAENAVGPRFFGLSDEGPLDITGAASRPFEEIESGYHSGSAGIVYGDRVPAAKRAELLAHGVRGKRHRSKSSP